MERKDLFKMSVKEIDRLRVIQSLLEKRVKQRHAARQLGLSTRQVRRLCRKVKREGCPALRHGLRGRPSNHQLTPGLLDKALALVKERYEDFGPTFANEKLEKKHQIRLSTWTLRRGMIAEGLWRAHREKPRHRAWRERRPCVGELVQLDGSDHDWFEGRGPRCALVAYIDDATSRILYAEFVDVEDTLNLLKTTRGYLLRHGRPVAFYVDKDSIYTVNRQATVEEELRAAPGLTQFTRAMDELGIQVITANSPQAKGRVERGFRTHQDRLVKELRLAGICTKEAANRFLWDVYIPEHNRRYAVEPANAIEAHRSLRKSQRLEEILSLRTERHLMNDFTLRYQNRFLQIGADQPVRVRPKDAIVVEVRLDGSTHLRFKGRYLPFKWLDQRPAPMRHRPKDWGDVRFPRKQSSKPPANHPWRFFKLPGTPRQPAVPLSSK